jgi:hypothetical protein
VQKAHFSSTVPWNGWTLGGCAQPGGGDNQYILGASGLEYLSYLAEGITFFEMVFWLNRLQKRHLFWKNEKNRAGSQLRSVNQRRQKRIGLRGVLATIASEGICFSQPQPRW